MKRVHLIQRFASAIWPFNLSMLRWPVVAALMLGMSDLASQAQVRKQVLMINELGQSHPGPELVAQQILSTLERDRRFQAEVYSENLDTADVSDEELQEQRDSLIHKYRRNRFDVVVLVGPDPLRLLADPAKAFYPDTPVVFCCAVPGQVERTTDSRSTGSWFHLDPAKTLEAALRLLPDTRQVFVVAGQSRFDRGITALVKAGLNSYESRLNITYLTSLPMKELQEEVGHLPSHSIVLYLCYFKDVEGREFLNVAEALPLVTAASNVPVFGLADTYLGRGIVGGFVVSFAEQGKVAARDVSEILGGKPPQDISVVDGPSAYMFDWRELRRWNLDQSKLPAGSAILFRQPTLWEKHRLTALIGLLIFASFSLLTNYLLFKQKELTRARKAQEQLSGMLITAQEKERSRLASEIHDDFSQRLALLALGLANAEEAVGTSPQEAAQQMHTLMNSASEIGADLHTLSHRLHSSTLERLGLVPGVTALCKEFTIQQGIEIDFLHENIPHSVHPDVALCLFRIVQESLRNLKKHSGVANARVRLRGAGDKMSVSVCDQGVGFDAHQVRANEGLGVRSMEERAYLLGGRLEIHSELGKGTTIEAWVPLQPKFEQAG